MKVEEIIDPAFTHAAVRLQLNECRRATTMMPRIQASKLQDGSHKYCPGNGMLEDIAVAVTVFTYRTECCLYFEASYASPIQTDNNSYGDAERSPDREQRNAVGNVPPPPSCLFILKLHNACDESLVVLGRSVGRSSGQT